MAKRKASEHRVDAVDDEAIPKTLPPAPTGTRVNPLVFISHDSRDADLAQAFDHLLTDASGGVIQTFRSSDKTGKAGIDYGEDWFSKITKTLADASDVVALLTPNSVDRPWILFEAGFAVGQRGTKVYGIALGVPFAKATGGPFARFQNCEAKEDTLTTVVLELIKRNPNARPREEAVRRQVSAFLAEIEPLLKERVQSEPEEEMGATAAAKLFEEVKVMFRDLPDRVEHLVRKHGIGRRRRLLHPGMLEEIFHLSMMESEGNPGAAWLFIASSYRDDIPWLSEIALQFYRAYQAGDPSQIEACQRSIRDLARLARHSSRMLGIRGPEDEEMHMFARHLPEMLEHFMPPSLPAPVQKDRKPRRGKDEPDSEPPSESKG